MAEQPYTCQIRSGMVKAGLWPLDNSPIKGLVEGAGFGWCSELKRLDCDRNLIAALLHTFDPKTSTFKINDQNYMITLEDIIYLTSLNVDGPPVTPKECKPEKLCLDLLGVRPPRETKKDIKRPGEIKLDWLRDTFINIEENASEERKQQCARAHILYMIGTCILPSPAGGRVSLIYLDLLRDFKQIKSYAWGSAMLASLLYSLCNTTLKKISPSPGGNGILLQLWAYEHFRVIRPSGEDVLMVERTVPLLKYWSLCCGGESLNTNDKAMKKKDNDKNDNITKDRNYWDAILKNMDLDSVDLEPYEGLNLSENLRRQLALKKSRTIVICLDHHAWLRPDVCHVQCGPVTHVLGELPPIKAHKKRSGTMKEGFDWYEELSGPVHEWERRWNTLITVENNDSKAPCSPAVPLCSSVHSSSIASSPLSTVEKDVKTSAAAFEIPFSFDGIPLSWPLNGKLTLGWIQILMSAFDWCSRNYFPSEFPSVFPIAIFDSLILFASKILTKEPNCVRIDICEQDTSVVVVGDVHGQLHDVLYLLRDAGFPSENRLFVFNGNYVDRGAWGLETFLLLLAWKVFMPHRVYLLRGNHETAYCTSVYGFRTEVETKYGDQGVHVYQECLKCFRVLPLASIIARTVYTAHGGLFRSVIVNPPKKSNRKKRAKLNSSENSLSLGSLEELSGANRLELDPPCEGLNVIPGDVLWSDPSPSPGLSLNKERGIGLLWGPDCTEDFLKKNHLKLIIRSHEGPGARKDRPGLSGMYEGYTIDHIVESGELITVFSAPDYPQFQATEERYNNKGAYIVLEPPNFDTPEFHTFEAITPKPNVTAYYNYEDDYSDEEVDLAKVVPAP